MKTQSQSRSATPDPIDPKSVIRQTVAGVKHVDTERAEGYAGLLTLRDGKIRALARREELYAAKYGDRDPRVARARQQREANERLMRELDAAHSSAATPPPEVDEKSYVLHGFVRSTQREPQPGLTVALYDRQGEWVREASYGCTDEHGYFLLRYQPRAAAKSGSPKADKSKQRAAEELKTQQQIVQAAGTREPNAGQATANSLALELQLHRDKQLVHRDPAPVEPRLNRIEFREIVIDGDGGGCVSPDKNAPMPPTREKSGKVTKKTAAKPRRKSSG